MEVGGQLHVQVDLPPGEKFTLPMELDARWFPEPVWTFCRREQFLDPPDCPLRAISTPGFKKLLTILNKTVTYAFILGEEGSANKNITAPRRFQMGEVAE
jgi:hypothetical protein